MFIAQTGLEFSPDLSASTFQCRIIDVHHYARVKQNKFK